MGKAKRLSKVTESVAVSDISPVVDAIVSGMKEKKGHDIVVMDLKPTGSALADYFVICHGDSRPQVEALARSVEEQVYMHTRENPAFTEGAMNAEWILLDYINVVVHIFQKEQRDFYGIERFWADANTQHIT
jgi:ribosome-associated protein